MDEKHNTKNSNTYNGCNHYYVKMDVVIESKKEKRPSKKNSMKENKKQSLQTKEKKRMNWPGILVGGMVFLGNIINNLDKVESDKLQGRKKGNKCLEKEKEVAAEAPIEEVKIVEPAVEEEEEEVVEETPKEEIKEEDTEDELTEEKVKGHLQFFI